MRIIETEDLSNAVPSPVISEPTRVEIAKLPVNMKVLIVTMRPFVMVCSVCLELVAWTQ